MKIKLVRESLISENNEQFALSAGLVIIQENTILLAHPKNSKWWGTYSIPKGHVDAGEDLLSAAIRETQEEVGVSISPKDIESKNPKFIDFLNKKGKAYKRVYYFVAKPKEFINSETINVDGKEMDWAGFLTKEKASQRISPKLKSILDLLKDKEDIEELK